MDGIVHLRIKPPYSLHNNCWHAELSDSAANWIDSSIAKAILRFIGGPAGGVVYHGAEIQESTWPSHFCNAAPINRWMIRKDIGNMRAQRAILSLSTKTIGRQSILAFFFFLPHKKSRVSAFGCWERWTKKSIWTARPSCDPLGSCKQLDGKKWTAGCKVKGGKTRGMKHEGSRL